MLWTIFFVVVLFGVGLGKVEKANAGYCVYVKGDSFGEPGTGLSFEDKVDPDVKKEDCSNNKCPSIAYNGCSYIEDKNEAEKKAKEMVKELEASGHDITKSKDDNDDVCVGIALSEPRTWFNCILICILRFFGFVLSAAASLFATVIDPKIFSDVVGNKIIYQMWTKVRDVLNIAFILTLIFSAFATVFGVDKFSYKKILLTIIIMALLVNFSFPIARVIIDFSNVIMYYFVEALGIDISSNNTSIFAKFADDSGLSKIVKGGDVHSDTTYLIAAIIFTFIFTITLLIIAVLFLIRMVVLAILIIFSPVAFVGSIVPFLSSQASKWWDALFKHSFFGPVMMFGIYIAMEMMKGVAVFKGKLDSITGMNASGDLAPIITAMAFFAVPISILWTAISFAQNMSVIGAGAVVGRGRKFMGWAGKTMTGGAFVAGTWGAYRARRKEGSKDWWRNRIGAWAGSKQDQAYGKMGGRDAKLRYEKDLAQKTEQEAKRRDTANMTTGDLNNLAAQGNRFEKAAAIQELANRNQATASQLDNVRQTFGSSSQVFNQLAAKVRTYDPVAAFATKINQKGEVTDFDRNRMAEHMKSNQFDANKIGPGSLGNADFMQLAFENQALSNKNLEDLQGKSSFHKNSIKSSLKAIASKAINLSDNEINRNIQIAHFAQTGELTASLRNAEGASIEENARRLNDREQIFKRLNKDTMKRMELATVEDHYAEIAANINTGKYKDALPNIENKDAQRRINNYILNDHEGKISPNPSARSLRAAIDSDPRLKNIQ